MVRKNNHWHWTMKEEQFLRDNYLIKSSIELGKQLNKSYVNICYKLKKLKLRKYYKWSIEEDNFLKDTYLIQGNLELSKKLRVNANMLSHRLRILRLKRPKELVSKLIKNTQFKKGFVPYNKEKTLEEMHGEEKAKQLKLNHSLIMTGRKQSEETKKKRSLALTGKNNPMYGTHPSEETRKKMKEKRAKQILPLQDTKIEVKIQEFLKQLEIPFFTHQYMKEIEHSYCCDIFVPKLNLVIECDGDYWHKYPTGTEIDYIRTSEMISKGFKVLRLWENEIKTMGIQDFENQIFDMGGRKK